MSNREHCILRGILRAWSPFTKRAQSGRSALYSAGIDSWYAHSCVRRSLAGIKIITAE